MGDPQPATCGLRGHTWRTSTKFPGFWTPSPPFSAFVCFSFDPPYHRGRPLSAWPPPGWIRTSVWMHVTWQFLSPMATQVNGMHENWKWSKNDILWRKDLNASAAPLCPKIMYARTWNCQIRHLKKDVQIGKTPPSPLSEFFCFSGTPLPPP